MLYLIIIILNHHFTCILNFFLVHQDTAFTIVLSIRLPLLRHQRLTTAVPSLKTVSNIAITLLLVPLLTTVVVYLLGLRSKFIEGLQPTIIVTSTIASFSFVYQSYLATKQVLQCSLIYPVSLSARVLWKLMRDHEAVFIMLNLKFHLLLIVVTNLFIPLPSLAIIASQPLLPFQLCCYIIMIATTIIVIVKFVSSCSTTRSFE